MAQISLTDRIFVNVMFNGANLLNLSLSGFDSLKTLMQHLHTVLRNYSGKLLTLQLRNSTRGWYRTNSILFA